MESREMMSQDNTLHLPRILCLHGGGTNARIFRAQCRALISHLKNDFRLVFAEAAFPSEAGSDVLSVYKEWYPFKRWMRWLPHHSNPGAQAITNLIDESCEVARVLDDLRGARGDFVAVLGFSQGAKVAASLLFRQQKQEEMLGKGNALTNFKFGILLAGRGPLVSLGPEFERDQDLPDASQLTGFSTAPTNKAIPIGRGRLKIPTIHVHGLKDPGIELHRQLYDNFCDVSTKRLIVWDGDHRVPLRRDDVSRVVTQIKDLARSVAEY